MAYVGVWFVVLFYCYCLFLIHVICISVCYCCLFLQRHCLVFVSMFLLLCVGFWFVLILLNRCLDSCFSLKCVSYLSFICVAYVGLCCLLLYMLVCVYYVCLDSFVLLYVLEHERCCCFCCLDATVWYMHYNA